MKASWQTKADRLLCRWHEVGCRAQYKAAWIRDAGPNVDRKNAPPPVLDFARLSPFGGRHWYVAHRPL